MARELGFAKAMHVDLASLDIADFDWEDFAFKEELIRFILHDHVYPSLY